MEIKYVCIYEPLFATLILRSAESVRNVIQSLKVCTHGPECLMQYARDKLDKFSVAK